VEGYHGVVKSGTHTFLPTERVHFGAGSIRKLAEEARAKARAFVVTGRTLHEKTDLVRRVEAILGRKHAGTFVGMSEHAPRSVVEKAAKGGAGLGLPGEPRRWERHRRDQGGRQRARLPEASRRADHALRGGVGAPRRGDRRGGGTQRWLHGPERRSAGGHSRSRGDALYAGEALALDQNTGPRSRRRRVPIRRRAPHHRRTGLEGARLLLAYLPRSREEPEDVEARLELQIAAWLAYFGPFNTPMGLSYALGRRIGASYEVPHGITSCITLAPSLKVARYQVQEHRWRKLEEDFGGDPAERILALVGGLDLPSRLRDVGVPERDLEEIAGEFSGREGDALTILRDAY
jgi:maleylacetate reductase